MYVLDHPTKDYKGLIFLAQPRTASTSISMALMRMGAKRIGGHHEWTDMALLKRYFVVSGVRDHKTAFLSFYGRETKGEGSLDAFCDEFLSGSHTWVKKNRLYWRHYCVSDFVYRYESLQYDLDVMCGVMRMDKLELKQYQHSVHPAEIPKEIGDRISAYFQQEREELGYVDTR